MNKKTVNTLVALAAMLSFFPGALTPAPLETTRCAKKQYENHDDKPLVLLVGALSLVRQCRQPSTHCLAEMVHVIEKLAALPEPPAKRTIDSLPVTRKPILLTWAKPVI